MSTCHVWPSTICNTPGPQPRSARLCGCSYRGSLWHYTPFFTPRQGISVRDRLCVSASSSFARRRNACAVFSRFPSPRRSRAADTVHNLYYRHRCPVHGTAYASLFLHPSASVITQLGQSCSAATRLSLHIPPAHVAVDTAQ